MQNRPQNNSSSSARDFVQEHSTLKQSIDRLNSEIKDFEMQLCWKRNELQEAQRKAHELIILMIDQKDEKEFDKSMAHILELYK